MSRDKADLVTLTILLMNSNVKLKINMVDRLLKVVLKTDLSARGFVPSLMI
jgi:hypothetical protein